MNWMVLCAMATSVSGPSSAMVKGSFQDDVNFLKRHVEVLVLKAGSSNVAVVPQWQGRVVTSAMHPTNEGFGWINYEHIASGKIVPHINVFGGEDRIWLGPEGGQYSIFFKAGDKFDLEHWQTPAAIDSEPFDVEQASETTVLCTRTATFTNYSGHDFRVQMRRRITALDAAMASKKLGVSIGKNTRVAAFETSNQVINAGSNAWTEDSGLLSIWILGMLKHSPTTTVIAPYNPGSEAKHGPIVNDSYFGKVPADRLKIGKSAVFFKGDGQYRSKIGLNAKRAKDVAGSYDAEAGVLTIIKYTKPSDAVKYVNSMWEIQKTPFDGDVLNSYNDGPPAPGKKPLGPFYELESSSPAAELSPGGNLVHLHATFHFQGPTSELNAICKKVLGVDLGEAAGAFPPKRRLVTAVPKPR